MQVNYSVDVTTLDEPVQAAAKERPGKPVRIRIPLLLFRLRDGATAGSGAYRSWNNVSWIIECESAEEAIRARETLQTFFETVRAYGIESVHEALRAWLTAHPKTT